MDTTNEPTKKFEVKLKFLDGSSTTKIVEAATEDEAANKVAELLGSASNFLLEDQFTELIELDDTFL